MAPGLVAMAAPPGTTVEGKRCMKARALQWELMALGLLGGLAMVWSLMQRPTSSFKGQPVEPAAPAPAFTLVDQHGRPFSSAELRGKVAAIFFGYTHCPDVCPSTLSLFARARSQLQGTPASEAVRFVFVSVDPERDRPEEVRRYVELFDPAIIGLTGTPEQVQQVIEAWGIAVQKVPVSPDNPDVYTIAHTASVFLVDRAGRVRVRLPFGSSADDLVHDVQQLLRR